MGRVITKKLKVPVIVLIVLSMTLIPALTSPITSPVIVVLSGDEPIIYTANKISELLQKAIIVKKNNIFENLILMRAVGEVIYVGHGTQQGIKIRSNVVSWEKFAKEIHHVPSKTIYVAACYSENLAKIEKTKMVFGFKGLVDVDEAAYLTTATMAATKGDVEKAGKLLRELTQIMIGKIVEPWKYKLWLLYETKQIRGIWHVKYDPYLPDVVDYTHPDYYVHYKDQINIDDWWEKENSDHNFYTAMVPRSISGWAAEAMMAALFAYVGAHFGGPLGAAICAAAGIIVGYLAGDQILKDEKGVIWYWMKDWTVKKLWWNIYRIEWDWKMGAMCWWHYYGIGVPECHTGVTWPLWYGGNLLGLPEAPGW